MTELNIASSEIQILQGQSQQQFFSFNEDFNLEDVESAFMEFRYDFHSDVIFSLSLNNGIDIVSNTKNCIHSHSNLEIDLVNEHTNFAWKNVTQDNILVESENLIENLSYTLHIVENPSITNPSKIIFNTDIPEGETLYIKEKDSNRFSITINKENNLKIKEKIIFSDLIFLFKDGTSKHILRLIVRVLQSFTDLGNYNE